MKITKGDHEEFTNFSVGFANDIFLKGKNLNDKRHWFKMKGGTCCGSRKNVPFSC